MIYKLPKQKFYVGVATAKKTKKGFFLVGACIIALVLFAFYEYEQSTEIVSNRITVVRQSISDIAA